MERVKVYGAANTIPAKIGRGVFADALLQRCPHSAGRGRGAPEATRTAREFRGARVRVPPPALAVRRPLDGRPAGRLPHGAQAAALAHGPKAYEALGQLVAGAKAIDRTELRARYESAFMDGLKIVATRKRHTNVLQHMAGYFKKALDADGRQELQG